MYRLLLVSDREEIRELYEQFPEWETLGFEQPVVAADANEGIAHLDNSRFDAVSSLLSLSEGKRFFAYLSRRPEMFGMETARDEARLRREISSARRALSSRDAARSTKQVDDYVRVMQKEFICELLRGAAYDEERIDERLCSLKLRQLDASRPVCMSSFRLPQGDYFLAEVWRYGRERLENALRNIFESSDGGVSYVLLIINPHHMRLMAIPRASMSREQVQDEMMRHLERCKASLDEYFELSLNIKRVVSYDSLYALGRENAMRTAH
ncbi:MAG: hypothetical protein J6K32_00925 [Clostridia bacterium]|nr:hypothetical protein [Clostridia bacterium]